MTHVNDKTLINDQGEAIGVFPGHWQAVAAMLRLSNPGFRTLGGDKPEVRHVEDEMRRRLNLPPIAWEGRQP